MTRNPLADLTPAQREALAARQTDPRARALVLGVAAPARPRPASRRAAAAPDGRRGWEAIVADFAAVLPSVREETDGDGHVCAVVATLNGLRVVNASNGAHGHWSATAKRRKRERSAVLAALAGRVPPALDDAPRWVVTLTRVYTRRAMDRHDNLRGALKTVADAVAAWLAVDDADDAVTWRYAQRRAKTYAVEVRVEVAK